MVLEFAKEVVLADTDAAVTLSTTLVTKEGSGTILIGLVTSSGATLLSGAAMT